MFTFCLNLPQNHDTIIDEDIIINNTNNILINNILNYEARIRKLAYINKCTNLSKIYQHSYIPHMMEQYHNNMLQMKFQQAFQLIIDMSAKANKILDDEKPWKMTHENTIFISINGHMNTLRSLATMLYPFVPNISKKILNNINQHMTFQNIPLENFNIDEEKGIILERIQKD